MISDIKIKTYANVNHPVYERGYWENNAVSVGGHQNKILDKLLRQTGLEVECVNTFSPFIKGTTIFMPPKENFEKASNYYHALVHEVMHHKSRELRQDSDFRKAMNTYRVEMNAKPDIIGIISTIEKHGAAWLNAPENKPAKDVALSYLHQELKCEIVTIDILHKVGLRPDNKDLAHAKNIGRLAETVYSYAGLSIRDNANNPSMLKEYNDLYNSVAKELTIEKTSQKDHEH